jgi:hypothetical protein
MRAVFQSWFRNSWSACRSFTGVLQDLNLSLLNHGGCVAYGNSHSNYYLLWSVLVLFCVELPWIISPCNCCLVYVGIIITPIGTGCRASCKWELGQDSVCLGCSRRNTGWNLPTARASLQYVTSRTSPGGCYCRPSYHCLWSPAHATSRTAPWIIPQISDSMCALLPQWHR